MALPPEMFTPQVIIQQGLLDPVGAQRCDVTEWLHSVLSILAPVSAFNLGLNAAKSTHHTKKAPNKSCSELNFVQKSPEEHSLSPPPPQRGAKGFERLIWLKYDIVLKGNSQKNNPDYGTDM